MPWLTTAMAGLRKASELFKQFMSQTPNVQCQCAMMTFNTSSPLTDATQHKPYVTLIIQWAPGMIQWPQIRALFTRDTRYMPHT